ncbi:MAG: hypothetical protein IKK87_08610 [Bacteroidaceae bacterium]|nr:hypothetical protein [Bacteroidaceae bacterium]
MRILTISVNAWSNTIATGNTFSNFFSNISEKDEIANIYCRNEKIDNNICSRYFRITEREILKSLLHFKPVGVSFSRDEIPEISVSDLSILATNNSQGNALRKKRPALLLLARELIWSINTWRNKKLKKFLDDFKPDIIYMHGHGNWYTHNILWFCKKYTGAKLALFSGDDVYAYHRAAPLQLFYHWILRRKLKRSFTESDIVFGGSPQLCKEYSAIFNREIHPLYKVCTNLKKPNLRKRNYPLHAVYCGNLLYGREQVLSEIAKQIRLINSEEVKFQMHIYTGNPLSDEYKELLNDGVNCIYEGQKPFTEIVKVLDECDFSILAESFEPKDIKRTRLSFSTKIIDYMEADSALLCIGPSNIGSIDYVRTSGIGFFIHNTSEFAECVSKVLSNPELIDVSIKNKYEYALKHHSKSILRQSLENLINTNSL